MGLDAYVYCDCFELGLLRTSPSPDWILSIDNDGSLVCKSDNLDTLLAFDRWRPLEACEHEDGLLVAHRIGNIALVAALREELGQWSERFPVILSRVIYNGVHGGDFIPAADIADLAPEVAALSQVCCLDPEMDQFMRIFETQMKELVRAALSVQKPIVF